MAHSKSALKRWRQSLERRARNRSVKGRTRTLLNKALITIGGEPAESEESVRAAISALDRAAQKGVIHGNAAARAKSRLLKRFNLAQAQAVAAAAGSTAAAPESPPEKQPPRRRGASQPAAEKPPARRTTRGSQASDKPAADETPRRGRRTSS